MSDIEISMLDRCSVRQLKELLALASTDEKTTRNWLLEVGDMEHLDYLLTEMCAGIGQSGGALLRTVCSPYTPVDALVAIKSTAKRLAATAEGPREQAAATLLYHMSVASALAHGRNISSKDSVGRLPVYQELAAELSDERLAAIFERAVASFSATRPGEVDL